MLGIMCHELFCDKKLCIRSQLHKCLTLGGINAFDLGCLQGEDGVFTYIDLCDRV